MTAPGKGARAIRKEIILSPMTRREALKTIGLAGLGIAAAAQMAAGAEIKGAPPMDKPLTFTLPPLPYKSLDPVIDDATLALHHDKHHAAYVTGANKALDELAKSRDAGDFGLVKHWERELAFHGSGCVLHTLYWNSMWPGGRGKPSKAFADAIDASFGSFEKKAAQFAAATKAVEGSGWGLLAWDPALKRLEILTVEKHQDLTVWGVVPILVCDVWEHAYYLKYQNKRPDYVDAWMKIVDFESANARFEAATK
jgi:superoxide dismutase, Fe-Mn family